SSSTIPVHIAKKAARKTEMTWSRWGSSGTHTTTAQTAPPTAAKIPVTAAAQPSPPMTAVLAPLTRDLMLAMSFLTSRISPPPPRPTHDHIDVPPPASRANQPCAPSRHWHLWPIPARLVGRVGFASVTTCLAPDQEPNIGRGGASECHRRAGGRFHSPPRARPAASMRPPPRARNPPPLPKPPRP